MGCFALRLDRAMWLSRLRRLGVAHSAGPFFAGMCWSPDERTARVVDPLRQVGERRWRLGLRRPGL